jgi:mRNA interferase RelE/StbE
MSRGLRVSAQVMRFATRLAPEPRRALKRALRELASERGDILPLEGGLTGYHRLRVGRHRVIFAYASDGALEAIFAGERSLVYEVFEAEFVRRIRSGPARGA